MPTLETAVSALQAKDTGPVRMVLDKLRGFLAAITFDVIGFVDRILHGEETRHRRAWVQGVQGVGIDLEHVISEADLTDEFGMVVQRNVALIRDLSADVQKRIERVVSDAVLSGTRGPAVAKRLAEQFGILQSRAKLIARDQIAKATSDLNRLRQEQAGVTSYVWSTSLDERVRGNPGGKYPNAKPSHWAREGQTFRWDKPPDDGAPGQPINCRCVARAVIEL